MLETTSIQVDSKSGEKASFVIQVKYLQNATWQGTIQWLEGKKTKNFRSALELIKLMDNVLENSDIKGD